MPSPCRFEQLFDQQSSTLTYIVADAQTREAAIIDPVDHQIDRDLAMLSRLGLVLRYTIETHAHADHITSAGLLRRRSGALAAAPFNCGVTPADLHLEQGVTLNMGGESLRVLDTPGHTAGRENGTDLRDNRLSGDMFHLRFVWALGDWPGSLRYLSLIHI